MSYSDRNSDATSASRKPHTGYVCMSTVEDLSYTPSAEEKTRDAAQIVATGRRSWKTLKGRGEAVWPPHLEAALIEALERYRPDDSRSSKTLGRFSMRNRFISDYIFEMTGKRRTPKQVGSRLQQMRDTCKSEKILQLISRRNIENDGDSGTSSCDSNSPSASPSPESPVDQRPHPWRNNIWVTLVLERLTWNSHPPVINIVNSDRLVVHLAPSSNISPRLDALHPELLSSLEPTINFAAPFPLALQTSFSVFLDGAAHLVHTEAAHLREHSLSLHGAGRSYSVSLVPSLWHSLCESTFPTRYTIVQNLFPAHSSSDSQDDDGCISVVYNFTYPEPSTEMHLQPYEPTYSGNYTFMNTQPSSINNLRSWDPTSGTADISWDSALDSPLSPPNSAMFGSDSSANGRYDMPPISRSGFAYSGDSWVNGHKFPQHTPPLSTLYC